jgi:C-terminal processing protease CtpA/Prc
VFISRVIDDSPALHAGLVTGQQVVELNGVPLHTATTLEARTALARSASRAGLDIAVTENRAAYADMLELKRRSLVRRQRQGQRPATTAGGHGDTDTPMAVAAGRIEGD